MGLGWHPTAWRNVQKRPPSWMASPGGWLVGILGLGDVGAGTLVAGEAFLAFGPSCSSSALRLRKGLEPEDEDGAEGVVLCFLRAKNELII